MRRIRKTAAMVTASIAFIAGGAHALPDDPPKAHLRHHGERIQRARLAAKCWPNEKGKMGCSEKSPLPWPRADEVKAGSRLGVRLQWKKEPDKVHVDSYKSIGDNGKPNDMGKDIKSRLTSVKRDGETRAWDVRFRLHAIRHHYVSLIVQWPGGTGVYNVHVKAIE